jgi:tellurite resistance protein TerC
MDTIWLWLGFITLVIFLLALDLGVFHRKAHVPSLRESLAWTVVWIAVALAFNVGIYFIYEFHLFHAGQAGNENVLNGTEAAKLFFTGYLIEKSLSLDNIFVIGMVFTFFGVPRIYQHRVLFWGIIGALVLRAAMILLGVALIQMFQWMLYVFGILLLYTAIKMLRHKEEEVHPENNPLVKLVRRFCRMTPTFHEDRFFVKENGLRAATPMLLVLLVVESYDVIFALDSIPAIFAITQDPFIVFTSNVFAILGLRSLYFVMAAMIAKFRYLKISLSVILIYVAVKLLCEEVIQHYHVGDLMNWVSLGVIIVVMLGGILASVWVNKRGDGTTKE